MSEKKNESQAKGLIKFDKDNFFIVLFALLILAFFKMNTSLDQLKSRVAALEGENEGLKQQLQQNLNEFRQAQIDRMDSAQKSREQINKLQNKIKKLETDSKRKEESIVQKVHQKEAESTVQVIPAKTVTRTASSVTKQRKSHSRSMVKSHLQLADKINRKLKKIDDMTNLE